MRWAVLVLCATACGRVGFDAQPNGDGGIIGDPRGDAGFPATCTGDEDCGGCGHCAGNACVAFDFTSFSIGQDTTVATASDGSFWGWGRNENDPLLVGGTNYAVPQPLPLYQSYSQVGMGADVTTALAADGTLWSFGVAAGQWQRSAMTGWSNLQAAWGWGCATRADQTLWCWGDNYQGNLGDGTENDSNAPIQVPLPPVARYSIDQYLGCAIDTSGRIWCWGSNETLAAGDPDPAHTEVQPIQVGTDADWSEIVSGGRLGCAMKTPPSAIWCWGSDYATGQMGDTAVPSLLDGKTDYMLVRSNIKHSCAIDSASELWCWGSNDYGQLGVGDATARLKPVRIALPNPVDDVILGGVVTCAHAGGSWWCWGHNAEGEQGIGTTSPDILSPYKRCP